MAELFLNPWSMLAGLLLVGVPVIIHLINRMRFKRVRWAAMEFLLKAQKRMRRKLIFQQLLLLLLRMLIVALVGLMVGRFLGFNPFQGKESAATAHVVVIDDSPSMGDGWRGDDGQLTDAFEQAKRVLVEQIAPAASEATTPQTLDVIRLSDPATPRSFGRLNTATIEEAKTYLAAFRPTTVRGNLPVALKKAKEILDAQPRDTAQVVHVLGDFRSPDFVADGPAVRATVEALTAAKAKVHLVDVAHPFRADDGAKKTLLFHDNIAIVELRPSKAVVARYEEAEFLLRVRNFGGTDLKDVRVAVAVNGDDNKGKSVSFPLLPAKEEKTLKFGLPFDRIGTAEAPLDRFNLVTARLETGEAGGLAIDNVRHAVVEVKERLPILVVEGRPSLRDKKDGDGFYLQRMFTNVLGGFTWTNGTVADLEKADLRTYSMVLLLNVPTVSEPAAKALDAYARDGGGVGFFLGPDVKPADYNKTLYADGAGVFPVPLPEKPSEPLTDEAKMQRTFSLQKKLLLRDRAARAHPALSNIYYDERGNPFRDPEVAVFEKFFSFVVVGQYWPVKRLGKWRDDPNITELYCMPNDRPMGELEPVVKPVIDRIPIEQPKYAKYKPAIDDLRTQIRRTAASTEPLFNLANLLDRLLSDQRADGDPTEALIREFWAQPELNDLRNELGRLRDAVKFGDPLYLAKSVGRGRVTVVTTTAGETWTDWPTGFGRSSFVPIVTEMERYLSGGGAEDTRACGDPIRLVFDSVRYKTSINRAFVTMPDTKPAVVPPVVDLKAQTMTTEGGAHVLAFTETTKPGVYFFTATKLGGTGGPDAGETPEYFAAAVNVDARREGDLQRADRTDVLQYAVGAQLHSAGQPDWLEELKNRKTDLTEGGWIFLLLLLILLGEAALAVKLSFHAAAAGSETNARRSSPLAGVQPVTV